MKCKENCDERRMRRVTGSRCRFTENQKIKFAVMLLWTPMSTKKTHHEKRKPAVSGIKLHIRQYLPLFLFTLSKLHFFIIFQSLPLARCVHLTAVPRLRRTVTSWSLQWCPWAQSLWLWSSLLHSSAPSAPQPSSGSKMFPINV